MSEENIVEARRWLEQYNGMNDEQKLRALMTDMAEYTLWLDNDCMWVTLEIDSEDGDYQLEFDNYVGWDEGVLTLFKILGINASVC